jgi:hypothetical protein
MGGKYSDVMRMGPICNLLNFFGLGKRPDTIYWSVSKAAETGGNILYPILSPKFPLSGVSFKRQT